MTMPTLIQNHNKKVVETRLQKFYSTMNQAVKMAEVEYGDKKIWFEDLRGAQLDDDGNPIEGSSEAEKWFNKYLAPHLKIVKREILSDGTFIVYFPDGSALRQLQVYNTRDWSFFAGNPQKCLGDSQLGFCKFSFNFKPRQGDPTQAWKWVYLENKGFEPWKYAWDGTEEQLKELCYKDKMQATVHGKHYCATLIQYNGWKIPDDYPYKVRY